MAKKKVKTISTKAIVVIFTVVFVIILVCIVIGQLTPTFERADLYDYYGVSEDAPRTVTDERGRVMTTAVLVRNTQIEEGAFAVCLNGSTFLPLSYVQESMNQRFYYDEEAKTLLYALPAQVLAFLAGDSFELPESEMMRLSAQFEAQAEQGLSVRNGGDAFVLIDEKPYVNAAFVCAYTNVTMQSFDAPARVWLWDAWDAALASAEVAKATHEGQTPIRSGKGGKETVLAFADPGDSLIVVEDAGRGWMKIATKDALIGFIENDCLGDAKPLEKISAFTPVTYDNISLSDGVCLLWHQTLGGDDGVAALPGILERAKGINVIAPTFFLANGEDGALDSCASEEYVTYAHEQGLQVWAMIDNINIPIDSFKLLSNTTARNTLTENLMAQIDTYGIDGLNIDFEGLSAECGPHYIQWIRELSVACRLRGVVLSIDNYVPTSYTAFYNRPEQGIVADYVIVMGYDEHYAGSEPGSSSSLSFVDQGIAETVKLVEPAKVINAIPFFTRLWNTSDGTSTAIGMNTCIDLAGTYADSKEWLEGTGQYHISFNDGSSDYEVWLEDLQSTRLRLDVVKRYDIAGIGCWKAGLDTEAVWDVIREAGL